MESAPRFALYDGSKRKLSVHNPAWFTLLGWSDAEVKSRPVWDFIHPDDIQRTMDETAVIFQGQPTVRFINRWPHKQGGYRWISWVALSENGVMFCSGRDITQEIEKEAELAERTADRNALWSGISDVPAWKFQPSKVRKPRARECPTPKKRSTRIAVLEGQSTNTKTRLCLSPCIKGSRTVSQLDDLPNQAQKVVSSGSHLN